MLTNRTLDKLLFVDIETVSQYPTYKEMPEKLQELFKKPFRVEMKEFDKNWDNERKETFFEDLYTAKAPLFGQFNKIICISMGRFKNIPEGLGITPNHLNPMMKELGDKSFKFEMQSFYGEDEKKVLQDFYLATKTELDKSSPTYGFVGYGGSMFDFPVLMQRYMVNKMPIPAALDTAHLKPWEITHKIDPALAWKGERFDGGCSLDTLSYLFGIPSPKDQMSGADVKYEYWVNKNLEGIKTYCEKDVLALAQVYLCMKGIFNEVVIS